MMSIRAKCRLVGIVLNIAVTLGYVISFGTDTWVTFNNGTANAGLWNYCYGPNDTHSGNETSGLTTTLSFSSSSQTSTDDPDPEEDEENCHSFGVLVCSAYLHFVRILALLAMACVGIGMFRFGTLSTAIPGTHSDPFLRRHRGECLSLLGAILAKLALITYSSNYTSDDEIGDYLRQDGRTDTAYNLMNAGVFLTIPVVVLLMSPTLLANINNIGGTRAGCFTSAGTNISCTDFKYKPLRSLYRFITCQDLPRTEPGPRSDNAIVTVEMGDRTTQESIPSNRRGSVILYQNGTTNTEPYLSQINNSEHRFHNTTEGLTVDISSTSPAAPFQSPNSNHIAPPPSYEEVVMDTLTPHPPSSSHLSAAISADHVIVTTTDTSSSPMPPPPSYEEAIDLGLQKSDSSTV